MINDSGYKSAFYFYCWRWVILIFFYIPITLYPESLIISVMPSLFMLMVKIGKKSFNWIKIVCHFFWCDFCCLTSPNQCNCFDGHPRLLVSNKKMVFRSVALAIPYFGNHSCTLLFWVGC